jgi:hypothetical protein
MDDEAPLPIPRLRRLGTNWGWLGLAVVFATLLAVAQLLPTAEYLLQSQRAGAVEYEFAMTYSFWPWRFLTLLAPGLFGSPASGDYWGYANYWEDAVYIGLLPFLLGLLLALLTQAGSFDRSPPAETGRILFAVILVFAGAWQEHALLSPGFTDKSQP